MIEVLKEIILDSQEAHLFTGILRKLHIETVPGKATICMGVRRSGKSTFMHQIITGLEGRGIQRENIVHINFFDDRLHLLRENGPGLVIDAYYSLFPEKRNTETVFFFFDEIQSIPGWEQFIERIMRLEKCEIYITGSSASMLSREIATQMRGRSLSWEIFPFSFEEFLKHKKLDITLPLSSKKRGYVQNAFIEFWECGGFPEVVNSPDTLRIRIHQEYLQSIIFRDVIDRHDISHPRALRDLVYKLIDSAGLLYTINRLFGYLKSLNHKLQKSTVSQYLEWLEDSYFLFSVRLFDSSISRSHANPKKIYCIDHAMVNSVSSGILVNSGHLLENLVFIALRRKMKDIFYYKTKTGKEIDFIVMLNRKEKLLVQVCETMADENTRKREITALIEAMPELKLNKSLIVTRNESERVETKSGVIQIVPIWQFLLELQDPQSYWL